MNIHIKSYFGYISIFLAFALLLCTILTSFIYIGNILSPLPQKAVAEKEENITVIIDPGHGGEDGGTVGENGIYEKDLNLSLALFVHTFLQANGINSILTRKEDILLYDKNSDYIGHKKEQDLLTRKKIAEEYEKAIFISIHMNAFPETKYNGLQVYYSKNSPQSRILASSIQERTRTVLSPNNNRKIKAADNSIYLLSRLKCPAVLIECGFLSNPEDLRLLSDENYQKKLALCIFTSISEFVYEINTDDT